MKNLVTPFSILNFKKKVNEKIKIKDLKKIKNSVHRRRDLDSLGEYLRV